MDIASNEYDRLPRAAFIAAFAKNFGEKSRAIATIQSISLQIFEHSDDNVTHFAIFFNHIRAKSGQNPAISGKFYHFSALPGRNPHNIYATYCISMIPRAQKSRKRAPAANPHLFIYKGKIPNAYAFGICGAGGRT